MSHYSFGVCSVTGLVHAELNRTLRFFVVVLLYHHCLGNMTHIAAVAIREIDDAQEFSKKKNRNRELNQILKPSKLLNILGRL